MKPRFRVVALGQKLKALPPAITVERVKEELSRLASTDYTWATDDDNKLRSKLNDLEQRIKRIRRLKEGGDYHRREFHARIPCR